MTFDIGLEEQERFEYAEVWVGEHCGRKQQLEK